MIFSVATNYEELYNLFKKFFPHVDIFRAQRMGVVDIYSKNFRKPTKGILSLIINSLAMLGLNLFLTKTKQGKDVDYALFVAMCKPNMDKKV